MQFKKRPSRKSSQPVWLFVFLVIGVIGLGGRYALRGMLPGSFVHNTSHTSTSGGSLGSPTTTDSNVAPTATTPDILSAQGVIRLQGTKTILESPDGKTFELTSTTIPLARYVGKITKVQGTNAGYRSLYQTINVDTIWATSATSVDDTTLRYTRPEHTTVLLDKGVLISHTADQRIDEQSDLFTIVMTGTQTQPADTIDITVSPCNDTTSLCRERDLKQRALTKRISTSGITFWQLTQGVRQFVNNGKRVYSITADSDQISEIMPMIQLINTDFVRGYAITAGPILCEYSNLKIKEITDTTILFVSADRAKRGECTLNYTLTANDLTFDRRSSTFIDQTESDPTTTQSDDTSTNDATSGDTTDTEKTDTTTTLSGAVATGDTQSLTGDATSQTGDTTPTDLDNYYVFSGLKGSYNVGLPKEVYYAGYASEQTHDGKTCTHKVHIVKYDRQDGLVDAPDGVLDICPAGTRAPGYIGDTGEHSVIYRPLTDQGQAYADRVAALPAQ